MAGHRLGALEGGGVPPHPSNASLCMGLPTASTETMNKEGPLPGGGGHLCGGNSAPASSNDRRCANSPKKKRSRSSQDVPGQRRGVLEWLPGPSHGHAVVRKLVTERLCAFQAPGQGGPGAEVWKRGRITYFWQPRRAMQCHCSQRQHCHTPEPAPWSPRSCSAPALGMSCAGPLFLFVRSGLIPCRRGRLLGFRRQGIGKPPACGSPPPPPPRSLAFKLLCELRARHQRALSVVSRPLVHGCGRHLHMLRLGTPPSSSPSPPALSEVWLVQDTKGMCTVFSWGPT